MTTKISAVLIAFSIATAHLALSQENFSLIGIEYIGDSDKPVTPVVVSDSAMGAEWFRRTILIKTSSWDFMDIHVVSSDLMKVAISYTNSYLERQPTAESAASVSIDIITPQASRRILLRTEDASSLLDGLKEICKKDASLVSGLSHFQFNITPHTPTPEKNRK